MTQRLQMALIASLTLGLAPFTPHPHIWKQIMNLYHGRPMPAIDWFDLVMHGAPWVALIVFAILDLGMKNSKYSHANKKK